MIQQLEQAYPDLARSVGINPRALPTDSTSVDAIRARTLFLNELAHSCWVRTGSSRAPVAGPLTGDDAARVLRSDVLVSPAQSAGYLWPEPVTAADRISARGRPIWPLAEPQGPSWFIWVDDGPHTDAFAHPTRFFFIEIETGRYTLVHDSWWPTINEGEVWGKALERAHSPNRAFGPRVELNDDIVVRAAQGPAGGPPVVTADTLTGPTCPKGRRFAAILVLDDEGAFTTNGQKMWNHLNSAYQRGTFAKIYYATPRNIAEATHQWSGFGLDASLNALFAELAAELKECDTLFIHVSAHNASVNSAGTENMGGKSIAISKFDGDMGSSHISGARLAGWLSQIHCCRITLVLDACEAGIFAQYVKPYVTELVTAAEVGQYAIYSTYTGGVFTNRFIDRLKTGKGLKESTEGSLGGGFQSAWTQQLKEFLGKATVWDSDVQDPRVWDGDLAPPSTI